MVLRFVLVAIKFTSQLEFVSEWVENISIFYIKG